MIRCNMCSAIVSSGEIFYSMRADCKLPASIPVNQLDYAKTLLESRLNDYPDLIICNKCIIRAKETAPKQEKPASSNKEFAKPKPRAM